MKMTGQEHVFYCRTYYVEDYTDSIRPTLTQVQYAFLLQCDPSVREPLVRHRKWAQSERDHTVALHLVRGTLRQLTELYDAAGTPDALRMSHRCAALLTALRNGEEERPIDELVDLA